MSTESLGSTLYTNLPNCYICSIKRTRVVIVYMNPRHCLNRQGAATCSREPTIILPLPGYIQSTASILFSIRCVLILSYNLYVHFLSGLPCSISNWHFIRIFIHKWISYWHQIILTELYCGKECILQNLQCCNHKVHICLPFHPHCCLHCWHYQWKVRPSTVRRNKSRWERCSGCTGQ